MQKYNLTTPQKNIWNLQTYYEGASISNICGAVIFDKDYDYITINKAVNKLIELQEGLRLQFCQEGNEIVQYAVDFCFEKFERVCFNSTEELDNYAAKLAKNPMVMLDSKMYRFVIFKLNNRSGVLACTNHLISDAWTFSLIAQKISDYCKANSVGEEICDRSYHYTGFVRSELNYFESKRYDKDKTFWETTFAKKAEPSYIKTEVQPAKIPSAERFTTKISLEATERINIFCEENSISQAVVFESALFIYLSKINPENNLITIGNVVLNRNSIDEKNTAGMFISTLPLKVEVSENDSVADLMNRITTTHMSLFRHQKYPYGSIADFVHKQHGDDKLYHALVSFQNAKIDSGVSTRWYSNGYSEVPFSMHIDDRDESGCYTITIDYQTEIFRTDEIPLIFYRLLYVIEQMLNNPSNAIANISIIPEQEYQKIIFDFNDTAVEYPRDKCVHELFEDQVKRNPDKIAIVYDEMILSYKELDNLSNRLANRFIELGIQCNDLIAFSLPRDYRMIVAILGILKAGAGYLPIDDKYPHDRVEYILNDSSCKLFITKKNFNKYYSNNTTRPEKHYRNSNICYCIYTSGSTGKPKGTLITHKNIINLVYDTSIYNDFSTVSIIALMTTIVFDVASQEILTTLLHGKTGVICPNRASTDISTMLDYINNYNVDLLYATPSYFNLLSSDKSKSISVLSNISEIALAGESFYINDLVQESLNCGSITKFHNQYGPAETAVISVAKCVNTNDITIGKPIANTQIYILDQNRKPLPIGIAGELCISGDGVGKGYLNNPKLTAEKFIPNPFIEGKTMYCTGDLARWRADGEIEYLGRIDTQVKIRGLRIELGEVESVMSSFDGIALCAVTDKRDENNRQYLVGYYTSESEVDEKALRGHLSAKLPKYMVPNYFMHLEAMPMTASGKTDRKHLPLPVFSQGRGEFVAPRNETEQILCELVGKLLSIENVGITDDFFELGGDSLLAITLLSQIETTFDVHVSMKDILERSMIGDLANTITESESSAMIPKLGVTKYLLLPQQQAIYAYCLKNPGTLTYNMPARIILPAKIDKEKLKNCIKHLFNHHRSLSTRIVKENDLLYGEYSDKEILIEEYNNDNYLSFLRPFDLSSDTLVRIGFTENSLLIDMHHIITDGTSLDIIMRDLAALYTGKTVDAEQRDYSDYAQYIRNSDHSEHKAFFKDMLKCDFEPVCLPEKKHSDSSIGRSKTYRLNSELVKKAKEYSTANGLTETMFFFGAFGILLSKFSGKNDVLTSIILSNRIHSEISNTVGMFVNTLPIYLNTDEATKDFYSALRSSMLDIYKYQELSFNEIADTVKMDKNTVNTSFVYQANGVKTIRIEDDEIVPQMLPTNSCKFDLTFEMTPDNDTIDIRIEYNSGKYEDELIDRLFSAYVLILEQINKERVSEISVLTAEEYKKVIYDFNDTAVEYPRDKCVHELFEEQVKKTPNKIALIFEDNKFTYKQIDEMSNSLAHYLREEIGIKPNVIVPIIAKRSWHIIVAMLGILKAGSGFTLIDANYPKERIDYLLKKCDSVTVLTFSSNYKIGIDLEIIDYNYNINRINNVNISDDFCCAIHTSGSTGLPKLTILSHRNITSFTCYNKLLLDKAKQVISSTIITFDAFILESIVSLICGVPVILLSSEQFLNQIEFENAISNYHDSFLFQTPSKLLNYINNSFSTKFLEHIVTFLIGGEVFTNELASKIKTYSSSSVIYNGYGPCETTFCTSCKEVIDTDDDITIGKPITNTQIYILDKNRNPLPIGVAGELCISGDGVGKGYLNNPELTAEKFIPNPFIEGKTMYCSGDLARWRADGEIEYLGRIDTQVKIRGLRIELGEIESVMSSFDGIALCAVADKRDENNRQYLVGYYTSESEIDEKLLRTHLLAKLPKYMVPNYFVRLEAMPMTASGKTDRKNLPLPDFSQGRGEFIAPRNETEQILCELVGKLLSVQDVGITDNFFELGGDSLKAIEYIAKAHNQGIEIALQNIFDYPTIKELSEHLNNKDEDRIIYNFSDFIKYEAILKENVIKDYIPKKKPLGNVLLTGATGFLGAHILDYLMQNEKGKIYCLVRSNSPDDRRGRWPQLLNYYFGNKYDDEFYNRIIPIVGDIELENLSDDIPDDVNTIIHTAATVKHFGSYSYFENVNVFGTKNVVNYAKRINARLIHISTLSVSGNSMADAFDTYYSEEEKQFDETTLYWGQPLDNVYVRSKFEAERVVLDAVLDGLDAKIIRVGNLTNRASDLKFQPNYAENAFLKRIKAFLEFGLFPDYLMELFAEFSPIDETAAGVVKIAQYADKQCIFHLGSDKEIFFVRLIEILDQLNIPMNVVGGTEFNDALQKYAKSEMTEYIYEAFQNDMNNGVLQYDTNIRIVKDFTVDFLRKVGFEWSEIDYDYISRYIDYFRKLGFLEV